MGMLDFYLQHRPPESARPIFKSIAIGDHRSEGQRFGNGDFQMYMSPSEAMKSAMLTRFHHASKAQIRKDHQLSRSNYWSDESIFSGNEKELAGSDNESKEPESAFMLVSSS